MMPPHLKSAYFQALKEVTEGKLHIVHVGLYEYKRIIVLHTDKEYKKVKVVDCTSTPGEPTTKDVQKAQNASKEQSKKAPATTSSTASEFICSKCGKECKSKSGLSRHEKKCKGK